MNINTVFEDFLFEFPELSHDIENRMMKYGVDDRDGIYIRWPCIMKIVAPILEDVENSERNHDLLERVFDFFERMATCPDEDVINLCCIEVTGVFLSSCELYEPSKKYMKRETRKLFDHYSY